MLNRVGMLNPSNEHIANESKILDQSGNWICWRRLNNLIIYQGFLPFWKNLL